MLLATTQVEDFDRFLEIFSTTGAEKRKEHGSKGAVVFRDPSESDRIWAIFDCISTDAALCRNLPKGVWLILVLILPDIGSIAWLLLGRPQNASSATEDGARGLRGRRRCADPP